jgi:hypothetical protein
MDIKHLRAGSTVYLPVEVDGALFSVGDCHAAQGDDVERWGRTSKDIKEYDTGFTAGQSADQ